MQQAGRSIRQVNRKEGTEGIGGEGSRPKQKALLAYDRRKHEMRVRRKKKSGVGNNHETTSIM